MASSRPGPLVRRARRVAGRTANVLDWLADPHGRTARWLGLVVLVLGVPVAVVTLVTAGGSSPSPAGPDDRTQVEVAADVPFVDAEVGHLMPDPAALALSDRLSEGEILRLRLHASSENVYTDWCRKHLLAACDVTWVVKCGEGYVPPSLSPGEAWPAGVEPFQMHCQETWSLRTVNRAGRDVPGWTYAHGTFSLEGFFVVDGVGFGQGILEVRLREIPAEVARQLVR